MCVCVCVCMCACVCVCVCVCVHSRTDKLSVGPLNLSDRILMLIPMVNSPEILRRKLIRPVLFTTASFSHTYEA